MIKQQIGRSLYMARAWNRLGLDQVGALVNRGRSAIQRWEDGHNTPDLDELAELCVKLGHRFLCEIMPEGEAVSRDQAAAIVATVPPVEREGFGALLLRYGAMLAATPASERESLARDVERFAAKLSRMPAAERSGFVDAVTREMD